MIKICPVCSKSFKAAHHFSINCSLKCSARAKAITPEIFWQRVKIAGRNDCWEWQGRCDKFGYGRVSYQGKDLKTYRFAYALTHGTIPADLCVLHNCNNPPCCNPNHLRLGTYQDNSDDTAKAGHLILGEKSKSAKLTEAQVIEIRQLYATGKHTLVSLAKLFNVSDPTIHSIIKRKKWKHI